MKSFYRYLKIFSVAFMAIACVLLIPVFINCAKSGTIEFIIPVAIAVLAVLEILILLIFGKYVAEVNFDGETVIIETNLGKYRLQNKYFSKVRVENSNARTYIYYDDGNLKRTFVFYMILTFKGKQRLDINYLKANMPYTVFEEVD